MTRRAIVLDANILIRAVLGPRVRDIISLYSTDVSFYAPAAAYVEARAHLPAILGRRGVASGAPLAVLDALESLVQPIDAEWYGPLEEQAPACISERDPDDWPALACAMMLNCPIWTEDADFFGTGVATWTTSRVCPYLIPDAPAARQPG